MARPRIALVTLLAATLLASLLVAASSASEPESSSVTVPSTPGQQVVAEWTGTVGPGGPNAATNACTIDAPDLDAHGIELVVPADLPATLSYTVTVAIEWEPSNPGSDLILSLFSDGEEGREEIASSDGGSPEESVTSEQLAGGTYEAVSCAFANAAPQAYRGKVTIATTSVAASALPTPADPQGLEFSASVPADLQRDEGEPIIEIDGDGTIYTCGPTGFSQAEDYLQVSTDGGDQFHLLGEPPRGQQSLGGGGDCGLATAPEPNDDGFFNLAYVGLSGLLEFSTATSADEGRSFLASPVSRAGAGVDRQWIAFSGEDTVFFNYNRVVPRAITVQRSDDAGLTYSPTPGRPISPNPGFPGPIRSMPAEVNPLDNGLPVVYYPWTQGTSLRLAVSLDEGDTWNNCTAAQAEGDPGALFAVADHDLAGNIYVVYTDQASFNTFLVSAPPEALTGCLGGAGDQGGGIDQALLNVNPGFSPPAQVNGEPLPTTVFPWIAAGGEPGRVGISYYGTQTPGRPDTLDPKTWHVYVAQSLNALDGEPTFSQVQATTHPNHYDQICLLGLACTSGGDRSLVDFFAIDYNPGNGEYVLVYNQAHKRPDDVAGTVSTPVVLHQIAGPSNNGTILERQEPPALRTSSADPAEDALADYSSLGDQGTQTNVGASDLLGVEVGPQLELETGEPVEDGGFTVRMDVADLSDAALGEGLVTAPAQSLLWIFRYVDGYRYAAASARWNPVEGFTFGHNDYVATLSECGSPEGNAAAAGDQCLQYPGDTPIQGRVDQEAGVIELSVPRELLTALEGPEGVGERPAEVPAEAGDRIYDATAFAVSNPTSPRQDVGQSFLYPLDNAPAFDFLVPGGPQVPGPDPEVVVERVGGDSRMGTALLLSEAAFPNGADTAVLARIDDYPDALAASALAAEVGGPVLLNPTEGLDDDVAEELERLGVEDVSLAGGVAALSEQVERDVVELGVDVERVGGAERFETAALIAREVVALGGPVEQAIVSLGGGRSAGQDFPDALAAGNLAATGRAPVLLVGPDEVPEVTRAALEDLLGDGAPVFLTGGTDAVSAGVERSLQEEGYDVQRLEGADRYATAVAIVEEAIEQGADPEPVVLATGVEFADALAAAPAAHQLGGVMLLVAPENLDDSPATRDFLRENAGAIDTVLVAGGSGTIADEVVEQVRAALSAG